MNPPGLSFLGRRKHDPLFREIAFDLFGLDVAL